MAEEDTKRKSWHQYLAAGSASIGLICGGTFIGWNSPSLVILLSEESPIKISYEEIAWMTAVGSASSSLAPIACTHFIDKFGRKPILLLTGLLYMLNWLVGAFAKDTVTLIISKVIAGIAYGITLRYTVIYTAEITEVKKRGAFGVLHIVSLSIGILFESIVGPRVSFSALQLLSMIFPILFVGCFFWMPETPYFLISRNRVDEAYDSLMWLRGHTDRSGVEDEMHEVKLHSQTNEIQSFRDTFRQMFTHRNRRALILMLGLVFGQHFSGMLVFTVYTELIFIDIDSPINPPDAVTILNIFALVFTFVSIFMMDKIGRKILVLVSLLGSCIFNALIGTYLILSKMNILGTESAWMAMLGIFGYKAFYSIGLASIPMILSSEIFQSKLKAWSLCVLAMYEALLGFTISKLFQVVDETIGSYFTYYMYSFACLLTLLFIIFTMPETKNKTFEEIQYLLDHKKENINPVRNIGKYIKIHGNGSICASKCGFKSEFLNNRY